MLMTYMKITKTINHIQHMIVDFFLQYCAFFLGEEDHDVKKVNFDWASETIKTNYLLVLLNN